ncbi:hypothetical protein SH2C18_05380 [Clostridium sediminicola]|uniref:DUF1292 domain-containing protein n=1 Tax=Clostridium sediminicola TaxID=3114879 RepID=UPI0031F23BF7
MKEKFNEVETNSDIIEIEIEDIDGRMIPCEIVDGFLFKSNEYALVKNKENNTVYLFKVMGDDDEAELVIPEEKEFKEASLYYEKLVEEE